MLRFMHAMNHFVVFNRGSHMLFSAMVKILKLNRYCNRLRHLCLPKKGVRCNPNMWTELNMLRRKIMVKYFFVADL